MAKGGSWSNNNPNDAKMTMLNNAPPRAPPPKMLPLLDKALAANEHYYVLLGKARLYNARGDAKNALAWVNKAIAKGKASTDVDLAPAQRLLAELKGM